MNAARTMAMAIKIAQNLYIGPKSAGTIGFLLSFWFMVCSSWDFYFLFSAVE